MRLATKAQIAALVTLVLCAAVTAQTLRSPQDPRNQAPAVGTGGPVAGPTGLFTVYDGDTYDRLSRYQGKQSTESVELLSTELAAVLQRYHAVYGSGDYFAACTREWFDGVDRI